MSEISRRSMLGTTGRAAVATLSLGGLAVAAGLPTNGKTSDDKLTLAVDAHRRLQGRVEAFSAASPPGAWSDDHPVEVEFNRLCGEVSKNAWRLLEIEAASVGGVVAFLGLVSDFTSADIWPAREDDEGNYVTFEADAIAYAAQALGRLTGGQANA